MNGMRKQAYKMKDKRFNEWSKWVNQDCYLAIVHLALGHVLEFERIVERLESQAGAVSIMCGKSVKLYYTVSALRHLEIEARGGWNA